MMIRRTTIFLASALLVLALGVGCASRSDITGFEDEARTLQRESLDLANDPSLTDAQRRKALAIADRAGRLADRGARIEAHWSAMNLLLNANEIAVNGLDLNIGVTAETRPTRD